MCIRDRLLFALLPFLSLTEEMYRTSFDAECCVTRQWNLVTVYRKYLKLGRFRIVGMENTVEYTLNRTKLMRKYWILCSLIQTLCILRPCMWVNFGHPCSQHVIRFWRPWTMYYVQLCMILVIRVTTAWHRIEFRHKQQMTSFCPQDTGIITKNKKL